MCIRIPLEITMPTSFRQYCRILGVVFFVRIRDKTSMRCNFPIQKTRKSYFYTDIMKKQQLKEDQPAVQNSLVINNQPKQTLSKQQQTFNRLCKQMAKP